MQLDELLNRVETAARRTDTGRWRSSPKMRMRWAGAVITDSTQGPPAANQWLAVDGSLASTGVAAAEHDRAEIDGYGGILVGESMTDEAADHVVATQPRVALALCAKLREYAGLVADLSSIILAGAERADPDGTDPQILADLDRLSGRMEAARTFDLDPELVPPATVLVNPDQNSPQVVPYDSSRMSWAHIPEIDAGYLALIESAESYRSGGDVGLSNATVRALVGAARAGLNAQHPVAMPPPRPFVMKMPDLTPEREAELRAELSEMAASGMRRVVLDADDQPSITPEQVFHGLRWLELWATGGGIVDAYKTLGTAAMHDITAAREWVTEWSIGLPPLAVPPAEPGGDPREAPRGRPAIVAELRVRNHSLTKRLEQAGRDIAALHALRGGGGGDADWTRVGSAARSIEKLAADSGWTAPEDVDIRRLRIGRVANEVSAIMTALGIRLDEAGTPGAAAPDEDPPVFAAIDRAETEVELDALAADIQQLQGWDKRRAQNRAGGRRGWIQRCGGRALPTIPDDPDQRYQVELDLHQLARIQNAAELYERAASAADVAALAAQREALADALIAVAVPLIATARAGVLAARPKPPTPPGPELAAALDVARLITSQPASSPATCRRCDAFAATSSLLCTSCAAAAGAEIGAALLAEHGEAKRPGPAPAYWPELAVAITEARQVTEEPTEPVVGCVRTFEGKRCGNPTIGSERLCDTCAHQVSYALGIATIAAGQEIERLRRDVEALGRDAVDAHAEYKARCNEQHAAFERLSRETERWRDVFMLVREHLLPAVDLPAGIEPMVDRRAVLRRDEAILDAIDAIANAARPPAPQRRRGERKLDDAGRRMLANLLLMAADRCSTRSAFEDLFGCDLAWLGLADEVQREVDPDAHRYPPSNGNRYARALQESARRVLAGELPRSMRAEPDEETLVMLNLDQKATRFVASTQAFTFGDGRDGEIALRPGDIVNVTRDMHYRRIIWHGDNNIEAVSAFRGGYRVFAQAVVCARDLRDGLAAAQVATLLELLHDEILRAPDDFVVRASCDGREMSVSIHELAWGNAQSLASIMSVIPTIRGPLAPVTRVRAAIAGIRHTVLELVPKVDAATYQVVRDAVEVAISTIKEIAPTLMTISEGIKMFARANGSGEHASPEKVAMAEGHLQHTATMFGQHVAEGAPAAVWDGLRNAALGLARAVGWSPVSPDDHERMLVELALAGPVLDIVRDRLVPAWTAGGEDVTGKVINIVADLVEMMRQS